MNILTGEASTDLFGGEVPPQVKALLEQARQAGSAQQIEHLLWTAQVCAPDRPAVYYLLYKFHASRGEYPQAEQVALKGLAVAAAQAGLPPDWQAVSAAMADFLAPGPARFWLFTLKALAFIRLKQGDAPAARRYLTQVQALDPQGGSGGDVIDALIRGSGG